MPAKPSGEIKTLIVRSKQKNGDTYLLEREVIYDPEKKYNKVLTSKLLAKIPKGQQKPIPTRPKRKKGEQSTAKSEKLSGNREHVGMMDIIDHIGKTSGIDDAIYDSTDVGSAQKIISLARYLLATNGQSLPGILTWQFNHPLPYASGLSEGIYHELFMRIGRDESLQQNFFMSRCRDLPDTAAIAYDSTTISTYSNNQIEARYGHNKAGDGLKTIKLLTLYSIDTGQPIAFTKQPGHVPDVISLANALKQLSALGVSMAELVSDNGFYSENNLAEMFCAGYHFITLVQKRLKWVRQEIDAQMEQLSSVKTLCPFEPGTHGVSVTVKRTFTKKRKYANHKNNKAKGDVESFERRIYLHIYFNLERQNAARTEFEADLLELKAVLESGVPVEELPEEARQMAQRYLFTRRRGQKVTVTPNEEACKEAYRYHGYFALVSNKEQDPFECLLKYRKRELIESFFEAEKQHADGTRPRVWNTDTLRGRMFVQFVTLCYYEYLSVKIRDIKQNLCRPDSNLTKEEEKQEARLLAWLKNTPLYLQLQWFDAIENVKVSSELKEKRWSTEVTARDQLYLDKLGLK